jgi:hypothetical protein
LFQLTITITIRKQQKIPWDTLNATDIAPAAKKDLKAI